MSSDPLTILYAENIEPALISALDSLDVDMFFALTLFHAPILDAGGLVAPLIIFLASQESPSGDSTQMRACHDHWKCGISPRIPNEQRHKRGYLGS